MNIRKNIDYSEMYEALDNLMSQQLSQMELYCEIGKAVCQRMEKGAAVMASEYLNMRYPDVKGFSPRNVRRMRDFYITYENTPSVMKLALRVGWSQNVAIMEADLKNHIRKWYILAAIKYSWSKNVLVQKILTGAHKCESDNNTYKYSETVRFIGHNVCYSIIKKFLIHSHGTSGVVNIRLLYYQYYYHILFLLSG